MWLYGDTDKSPGLLGFITSARKEHKGRPRARGHQLGRAQQGLHPAHPERPAAWNLIINVFENGVKNGVYAPGETEVAPCFPPKFGLQLRSDS